MFHSSGVNFFAQSLSVHEQYFLCPPVSLVLPCFKKVCSVPNISAVLIIPEWTGHVFWPFLFNGTTMQSCIRYIYRFKASFSFANAATSNVFSRNPNFFMLALLIHSEWYNCDIFIWCSHVQELRRNFILIYYRFVHCLFPFLQIGLHFRKGITFDNE